MLQFHYLLMVLASIPFNAGKSTMMPATSQGFSLLLTRDVPSAAIIREGFGGHSYVLHFV